MRKQPLQANKSRPNGSLPKKSVRTQNLAKRRALVLLIVVTMLSIFSLVALSFVFYAQSEATASRYSRQANEEPAPTLDPEHAFSFFLSQLLYGPEDNAVGWQSSMRGHSLATNMYGVPRPKSTAPLTIPYNGVGRLSYTIQAGGPASLVGQDNQKLVNYTWLINTRDGYEKVLRDPGYFGFRADEQTGVGQGTQRYYGGINPTYTYPDLNNMFLAVVNGNGEVLLPSFHRPWTGIGALAPPSMNSNWGVTSNPITQVPWTTDQITKMMAQTLRPLPAYHQKDGKSFPPPQLGGDVRNLPNATPYVMVNGVRKVANNDSIWMDLGYPVLTGPDGRKYKPLFAPLIMELDSRLNLNVHGNIQDGGNHAANHGLGPWEVSLLPLFTNQNQLNPLFNDATSGRLGPNQTPGDGTDAFELSPVPPSYARLDYDGRSNGGTFFYRLPKEGMTTDEKLTPFAKFDSTRYGNGQSGSGELTTHPGRAFVPGLGDDRLFRAPQLEALYRFNDTGSPGLTSDIFRLIPTPYKNANARTKRLWLVTTDSWDFPRPSLAPWLQTSASYTASEDNNVAQPPSGTAKPFPAGLQTTGIPNAGDFNGSARSALAALGKLDLNRELTAYAADFKKANKDRQQFAQEIYDRLVWVTTGNRPNGQNVPANPHESYAARQWLAQLAANIVDFIDEDDVNTLFLWNPPAGMGMQTAENFVYGTELPKVVINEVYSEVKNHPDEIAARMNNMILPRDFPVYFWVELHNPWPTADGDVELSKPYPSNPMTKYATYQIELYDQQLTKLRKLNNPKGDPEPAGLPMAPTRWNKVETSAATLPLLKAAQGAFKGTVGSNDGFYVIGPPAALAPLPFAGITPTYQATGMMYERQRDGTSPLQIDPDGVVNGLQSTILLRRLANPSLPPNNDATAVGYNPYITIDYVKDVKTYSGVQWNENNFPVVTPVQQKNSFGRREPYDGSELVKQQLDPPMPPPMPPPMVPAHSFFRHNSKKDDKTMLPATNDTLTFPFSWLVHLDRKLTSPIELLHVSGYRPHELTQQFRVGTDYHQHYARWFDPTTRLARFLELVETDWAYEINRDRNATGIVIRRDRRRPGKININMVWDEEVLSGLVNGDPATAGMLTALLNTRTPDTNRMPGPNDRPVMGLATAHLPVNASETANVGNGLNYTLLRSNSPNQLDALRALENQTPASTHPYRRFELLSKLFNNVTTRSNVFAVWLTVGFFEVLDEDVRPVILGPEIGRADNQHIRHRMFAIVDRTQIGSAPRQVTNLMASIPAPTAPAVGGIQPLQFQTTSGTVTLPTNIGMPVDLKWELVDGMSVVLDPEGPNEETVVLQQTGMIFQAYCTKAHAMNEIVGLVGTPVTGRENQYVYGHPGPQPKFTARDHPSTVLYYTLIN
ncbi:MAG: hypothetical protein ACFCD0_01895 [Gemmataceae bacterium]